MRPTHEGQCVHGLRQRKGVRKRGLNMGFGVAGGGGGGLGDAILY